MKAIMRKIFIPSYYYIKLHQKLQTLNQGFKLVDGYYKEMEMEIIRANVEEDREAIMARFLSGLNSNTTNIVELHHYVVLKGTVDMTIKIDR